MMIVYWPTVRFKLSLSLQSNLTKKGDHENVMTLRIGSLFPYRRRG